VWLDDAAGAVIKSSGWSELLAEELTGLLLVISFGSGAVDGVSQGIGAKSSSESSGSRLLGLLCVSWAKDFSEFWNCLLGHKLHSNADIALHESAQVGEKWLSLVLVVELICLLWAREFTHLQLSNRETVLVDSINNFSCLGVTVWLNHSKSPGGS